MITGDSSIPELNPPSRLLLGPGPANINSRVLRAMTAPLLGYLDPDFVRIMDDVAVGLRQVFGTKSFTLPVSGTGSAGMEAGLANLLEPGDTVIVVDAGYFGDRMVEMAERLGATVVRIPVEWGKVVEIGEVRKAFQAQKKVKLLTCVHAETSTGVLQSLTELSRLAKEYGALFMADTVTSLGANKIGFDELGIDFAFSGTQKCIGAPPGLSPCAVSTAALQVISTRKTKPYSWYLDIGLLRKYWEGGERVYHHTAPMSMVYALREALRMVQEEGLEKRWQRHTRNGKALRAGLQALGLKLLVPEAYCLYQLTSVLIPQGIDDLKFRQALLREYNIEAGAGLGKFRSQIWRLGLMGENSTPANVLLLLSALEKLLPQNGYELAPGAGVAAASKVLAQT
ncbi:MAG: alanine--glyoxylate aminotransferase family protein [Dehalococcoidia bacterium]|nr:alanine--glyoxylate aminotransferase family protein [Dehalococcoidia bacterium]